MPKYKIKEVDNTGSLTLAEQPNIVYIPGASSEKTEPIPVKTVDELRAINGLEQDDSYLLAKKLLGLGMQVLYQGFERTGQTPATISGSVFTINGVTYTIEGSKVTWTDGGEEKEATMDDFGVATLSKGLVAQVDTTNSVVNYPVAEVTSSTNIYTESDVQKFTIDTIEYTIGDNVVTWPSNSANVTNGEVTLGNIQAIIDYAHYTVTYTKVVATEGTIAISNEDWENLQDKNLYNFRFLTTGAYACPTSEMVTCASKRGDCIALLDHPKDVDYSTAKNPEVNKNEIKHAFAGLESTYSAAFTPWFTCSFDEGEHVVPASFGYLLAYARSVQSNPLWKAVAGVFRGRIPELIDVEHSYTTAECNILQGRTTDPDNLDDNSGKAINPIAKRRYSGFAGGFNYVINGNRTMLDGAIKATSFLNVRALITEISKTLYDASVTYTFEQNSDVLWVNFKSLITPLLDKMQSGEGIAGYRLDRMATTAKARLCARITIVPIEAVEDFELEIYLEDSLDATIQTLG